MTRPTPPRTNSLYDAQDRDHVILDMDRLPGDEFLRRHGDALRAMLIDPGDIDETEPMLDDYRADIAALEKALVDAQTVMEKVAKRLRQTADSITDLDSGDPMFGDEVGELLSLSDDLDKANDAANAIEVKTSW